MIQQKSRLNWFFVHYPIVSHALCGHLGAGRSATHHHWHNGLQRIPWTCANNNCRCTTDHRLLHSIFIMLQVDSFYRLYDQNNLWFPSDFYSSQTRSRIHQQYLPTHAHRRIIEPLQRVCILWRNNIRLHRVMFGAFLWISRRPLCVPHSRQWATAESRWARFHIDPQTEAVIFHTLVSHCVRFRVAVADDCVHRGDGGRCRGYCETILVWHTVRWDATVSQGTIWTNHRFLGSVQLIDGEVVLFIYNAGTFDCHHILSGFGAGHGANHVHSAMLLAEAVRLHVAQEIAGEYDWSVGLDAGGCHQSYSRFMFAFRLIICITFFLIEGNVRVPPTAGTFE